VVCHNADVGSNPAWSMRDYLWPRDSAFFPPKCFYFIIYQCSMLEILMYNLSMWQHRPMKTNLKYKKVNVTKTKLNSVALVREWTIPITRQIYQGHKEHTCNSYCCSYVLFPSVTFSLHSWYTHSNELIFPSTKITCHVLQLLCALWKEQNTRPPYGLLFT